MGKISFSFIKSDSNASRILDLLRFLSALSVLLYHFRLPLPGYQAVIIFFILSGYFISSTVYKSINEGKWNWGMYLIKRLSRLWIVLLPALILTLLWAKLQVAFFGGEEFFQGYLNWKVFLGNMFFLQTMKFPLYGQNGPLWSLAYEFWYYILFPCLLLIMYSKKNYVKVLYTILFLSISYFLGSRIMLYFIIWLLGTIIPLLKPIKFKNNLLKNSTLLLSTCVALVCTKLLYINIKPSWMNDHFISDLSLSVLYTLLIYVIISAFNENSKRNRINISKHLAGFSYTMYLTHYPVMYFIFAWKASSLWTFSGTLEILIKPLLVLVVLIYAWLISLLTEKYTEKVKDKLIHLVFKNNKNNIKEKYFPVNQ